MVIRHSIISESHLLRIILETLYYFFFNLHQLNPYEIWGRGGGGEGGRKQPHLRMIKTIVTDY